MLWSVGYYGYSWSSSVRGTSADHLDFGSGSIRPQNSDGGRTSGLPLRCLQEHPESVLLGFSPPNLEPGHSGKKSFDRANSSSRVPSGTPRASATPETSTDTVRCITSAAAGVAGRRRFLREVTMPTSWTSTPEGSIRSTTIAVGTVFSCVASRNRGSSAQLADIRLAFAGTA